MLNETYVEDTIKEWVKEHSVPFNKPIPESTVKCFTRTGSIETFDELTQCNFINYNGEILIVDEFEDSYDTFKQHFTHSKHDWNPEVFGSLVDALIVNKHIDGDSGLDDAYEISNDKILAVAKFFDFYPNLEKLIEERGSEEYHGMHDCPEGCIMFEGDDWDYDADYYYRDSDIYAKIVKCLKKYLHHELVPYRTYNPEYNPFKVKISTFE